MYISTYTNDFMELYHAFISWDIIHYLHLIYIYAYIDNPIISQQHPIEPNPTPYIIPLHAIFCWSNPIKSPMNRTRTIY